MKQKFIISILFILMLIPLLRVTSTPTTVQWGQSTHMEIAEAAINYLESDWQDFYGSLLSFVKGGSILPDSWHDPPFNDTPNHLYFA